MSVLRFRSSEKYDADRQSGRHQKHSKQQKEHKDLTALAERPSSGLLLVHGEQSQGGAVRAAEGVCVLRPVGLHHPAQHVHLGLHVVDHVGDAADLLLHGAVLFVLQAGGEALVLRVAQVRQTERPSCHLTASI